MSEINFPSQSTKTLLKASIAAVAIAVIAFITLILPAEYNVDPTGVGHALGLTALAQSDKVIEVAPTADESKLANTAMKKDMTTIVVLAGKGVEYKFFMEKHAEIDYEWETDGTALYFDFHGEPKGDKTGYFKSFTIATSSEMKGLMTVPFTGSHGWYWKNKTDKDVVVTLKTEGHYEVIGNPH